MKKYLLFLILYGLFFSCEKDDFCTKKTPVTPKLILLFYDKNDRDTKKKVTHLSAIAKSKKDSLFTGQNTDSIAIPLNVNAKETVYTLKMNPASGDKKDNVYQTISIKYDTENIFVSRSCGFKTIFNNVKISSDQGWFDSFTPQNLKTIDSEKKAHIEVFH